jgi:hypothetical protein
MEPPLILPPQGYRTHKLATLCGQHVEAQLLRMHLPRARVNEAALLSALGSVCHKIVHLCNALVYTGGGIFFGARERTNEIVGTTAEPRIKRRTS